MPFFDLKGILCAKYSKTEDGVKYSDCTSVGDAMNVNLDLRFAEGRVYAESSLAEYMKKATGGTISIGVKYIPQPAQIMMYGAKSGTRNVGEKVITSLKFGKKTTPKYVGTSFYAPDMIDGEEKFTAVFVSRALFGPPSMTFQTANDTITFQTPTTTGEFLRADNEDGDMLEVAVCDTEEEAIAWTKLVLGEADNALAKSADDGSPVFIGVDLAASEDFSASSAIPGVDSDPEPVSAKEDT